jgi:hypothetical protein
MRTLALTCVVWGAVVSTVAVAWAQAARPRAPEAARPGAAGAQRPPAAAPSDEGNREAADETPAEVETEPPEGNREEADVAAPAEQEPSAAPTHDSGAVAPPPSAPAAPQAPAVAAAPSPAAPPAARAPVVEQPSPRQDPEAYPLAVMLNYEPQWNLDPGYDLFDSDNVSHYWGLGLSYDLLEIQPKTALVAELGWSAAAEEQTDLYGGAVSSTELSSNRFIVALSAHYRIWSVFGPHVRLSGGLHQWTASLDGEDDGEQFEDSGVQGFVRLGAGVSAEYTLGSRLAAGLLAEGGYTAAKAASIGLYPADDTDGIATRTAELGKLSLSGPYLRVAGLARF